MSKGVYLNEESIRKIISDNLLFGKQPSVIASECNCSQSSVSRVLDTFSMLRDGRIEELAAKIRSENCAGDGIVGVIAAQLAMEIPDEIMSAMDDRKAARMARRSAQREPAAIEDKQEEPEPITTEVNQGAADYNETLYFCRILEELARHNELMEQLMDVVIPKYVSDLKDNLNANADMISEKLKRCGDALDGIKINTRKRGL